MPPYRAKISDFGLVRLVGEEWVRSQAQVSVQRSMSVVGDAQTMQKEGEGTSTRSMLGTYEYMSPEQKRGEEATAQSDLYSIGLMVFKLLTGQNPGVKTPSRVTKGVATGWDEFVGKSLEENAGDRWASADAMRDGFAEIGKSWGVGGACKTAADDTEVVPPEFRPIGVRPLDLASAFTNTLGMELVPVSGLPGVLFCKWETRVQDYEPFARATGTEWEKPDFEQGPTHLAVNVSWDDANAFCKWLTKQSGRRGRLVMTRNIACLRIGNGAWRWG